MSGLTKLRMIGFGGASNLPSWLAMGYNMDISQSEWQVAYWPIKFAIPFGAFLVILILISRFVKDIQTFRHFSEVDNAN